MDAPTPQDNRQVVYSAPTSDLTLAFARRVCRELVGDHPPQATIEGLATLIQITGDIEARRRNQHGGQVDNVRTAG